MTQPLGDLRSLLRGLHEHGVEYVLFGAMWLLFYRYARNTEKPDLAVHSTTESLDRVAEWLMSTAAVLS